MEVNIHNIDIKRSISANLSLVRAFVKEPQTGLTQDNNGWD